MAQISETRRPVRRDLTTVTANDHSAYREHRAFGATDYYGLPLLYGESHLAGILIVVSDQSGGLTDEDIAALDHIVRILAPLTEVHRLNTLATAVSKAYLGARSAERVLAGQITRGHIEKLEAAILVSDIRGWTDLNTQFPPEEAVARANAYFDVLSAAISDFGGEILKFLGDGVLAIFPAENGTQDACVQAFHAARQAFENADQLQVRFGVGLHVGEVLYGNTGAQTRLDFTVLGQAVNIAARIEAKCSALDQRLLMSQSVSDQLDVQSVDLGAFDLKGLSAPLHIHTVA